MLAVAESPTLLADYNALPEVTPADLQHKVEVRNQILNDFILLTDQNYNTFESNFFVGQAALSTAADTINIILTEVAAVTGTAHLKSVLASIAGGLTGIRSSYEKNFFQQETRIVIIQKMRAERAKEAALLGDAGHMKAGVLDYSLESGLNDVGDYYAAGTLVGALQAIAAGSGVDIQQAIGQTRINRQLRQQR